jgi:hypothetical protein
MKWNFSYTANNEPGTVPIEGKDITEIQRKVRNIMNEMGLDAFGNDVILDFVPKEGSL